MIEGLISVEQALQLILQDAAPSFSEFISLRQCLGRVLASDLDALRTQPPFDASAMDGYGIRHQDTGFLPVTLKIIGEAAAGHPFNGVVDKGEAVRIFTGAPIPGGVDTIIIQENTSAKGNKVRILKDARPGIFIRKAGLDFNEGEILLKRGHILKPQSIALAASMNYPELKVWKKPVVALLSTGDELALPGENLKSGQIIASNSFALDAIAKQAGAETMDMGVAADTMENLTALIQKAIHQGADLIITMGGASVGDHDLVLPAMQNMGFNFSFSRISMRPGKPCLFGKKKINNRTVRLLGLAGNPVSSIIAAEVFARPLIKALGGTSQKTSQVISAVLGKNLPANNEREEYMRSHFKTNENGKLIAMPFDNQDSSMLVNLTKANCLLIRPINAPAGKKGDICNILLLE